MSWTDPRVALLKQLHGDGVSFGAMALRPEFFSAGITRNALIGKAVRIGLPKRVNANGGGMAKRPRPRLTGKRTTNLRRQVLTALPDPAPEPPPQITDVARVTLLQLENDHCRFPIGNPSASDFGLCGAREADLSNGHPYCPAHAARCFTAPSRPVSAPGSIQPSRKSFAAFERSLDR